MIELYLPYPPTVNHYYVHTKRGIYIKPQGKAYIDAVQAIVAQTLASLPVLDYRLAVTIVAYPPDKRLRDIDNCEKAILDSITKSGLWLDDGLIDQLTIKRGVVHKGVGMIHLTIQEAAPLQAFKDVLELNPRG